MTKAGLFQSKVQAFSGRAGDAVTGALQALDLYAERARDNRFDSQEQYEYYKNAALGAMLSAHEKMVDDLGSLIGAYDDVKAWALNVWDQDKLNTESQAAERAYKVLRVKSDNPGQALRDQALTSQDAHKVRAAGEYLLASTKQHEQLMGNGLISQADSMMGTDLSETHYLMEGAISNYYRQRSKLIAGFDKVFSNNIESSPLHNTIRRVVRIPHGVVVRDANLEEKARVVVPVVMAPAD